MKTFKAKVMLVFMMLCIAAAFFSGCATRRVPNPAPGTKSTPSKSYSPELGTPATDADNLAKAVQKIPGIRSATAVISGDAAYIGINIDINSSIDNTSKIQSIKKQAADTVRNTDKNIKTVYVSADADFIQRITKISDDVRNGKPVEGFRDELNEIVKRITPEKQ